jgi:ribose transport system permease protein
MKKKTGIKDLMMRLGPALALILMFIVFAIVMPNKFLRVGNLMNVLKQASINCMIGAGMLLCLITAGIDLSVGYNTTLACCMIGVLLNMGVTSPFILIPVALAVSTLAGFINGTLLTRLELPHPFVYPAWKRRDGAPC